MDYTRIASALNEHEASASLVLALVDEFRKDPEFSPKTFWDEGDFSVNPYYEPSALGLKIVATLSTGREYSFSLLVVWKDTETGEFFWASDSGCSCPQPFEGYIGRGDLRPLTSTDEYGDGTVEWQQFVETVMNRAHNPQNATKVSEFLGKVARLVRG